MSEAKGDTGMSAKLEMDAAVAAIAEILREVHHDIMFVTCLDDQGRPSDSDCFVSQGGDFTNLPPALCFTVARKTGAPAVFLAFRFAEGSAFNSAAKDKVAEIVAVGEDEGIRVIDAFVVTSDGVISLRETTDLWATPPA